MKRTDNCLVKELSRVNNITPLSLVRKFKGLFTKDGLLNFKKAIKISKNLDYTGIYFYKDGKNWHANNDAGLKINEIEIKNCDLVGKVGGSVKATDTFTTGQEKQTQTKSNTYTQEQINALKNLLGASTDTTATLGAGLNKSLTDAFTGNLSDSSKSLLRTGMETNAADARNAATQTSEALAGRGLLNSGISNKMMTDIQSKQNAANQATMNSVTAAQQANLNQLIAAALGLTSQAGNLATQSRGSYDVANRRYWDNALTLAAEAVAKTS